MTDININIANKQVSLWLFLCSMLILCMVLVGGYTRLTDSGLSMTDWKPLTGILPPLNKQAWLIEFAKYKASPEYLKINLNMGLEQFKQIFWAEYWHRILGRIIGLSFLLPFLYFLFKRKINKKTSLKLLGIFLLIGLQGLMGWYMVKSGLVDNPHVSHYRLAMHLILAMIIYSLILLLALNLWFTNNKINISQNKATIKIKNYFLFFIFLIFLQTILGAFVAGLDAGHMYNSFPLMAGKIIPQTAYLEHISFFDNPAMVQFLHRTNAIFMIIYGIFLWLYSYKKLAGDLGKTTLNIFLTIILAQFFLGVSTLIYSVPLILGLLHQFFAFILVAVTIIIYYRLRN